MHQVGLIQKWLTKYLPKRDRCWNIGKVAEVNNHTVNLDDMQGCFFVLFLGTVEIYSKDRHEAEFRWPFRRFFFHPWRWKQTHVYANRYPSTEIFHFFYICIIQRVLLKIDRPCSLIATPLVFVLFWCFINKTVKIYLYPRLVLINFNLLKSLAFTFCFGLIVLFYQINVYIFFFNNRE